MADDGADQALLVEIAPRRARHDHTIAKHGDAIGKIEHLIEPVRDIEDRDAIRRQIADDRKKLFGLGIGQGSRRLIHGDHGGLREPGPC